MAALSPELSFKLHVTSRELVILCKLLGDRPLTDDEKMQAHELGNYLTRLRANALKDIAATAERLEQALEPGDRHIVPAPKEYAIKGGWRDLVDKP